MAKKNFDLKALAPERPTLTDFDGREHTVKLPDDFGVVDFARLQRLQAEIGEGFDKLQANPKDEEAAQVVEDLIDDFLGMLAPTLPEAHLAQMTFSQKYEMMQWWSEEVAGKATAADTPQTESQSTPSPN